MTEQEIFGYETLTLPFVAMRNVVAIPGMRIHLDIGRKKSVDAINRAIRNDSSVFLVTQTDIREEYPDLNRVYKTGVIANVVQMFRAKGEIIHVELDCICRADQSGSESDLHSKNVTVTPIKETRLNENESDVAAAAMRAAREAYGEYSSHIVKSSPEVIMRVLSISDAGKLADTIAANINLPFVDKQHVLCVINPIERLEVITTLLLREADILSLEENITTRVRDKLGRNQREFFLREQLKVIREELGDEDGDFSDNEIGDYYDKIFDLKLDEKTSELLIKEVVKLSKMPMGSQDAAVSRGYLDVCLDLPWKKYSKSVTDIKFASKILESDHYGLEKIKERILETIAAKQLYPAHKGQVLCLVGPPGTGKSSVAESVARAMKRKFVRVSLGGVHDESEIRGHRRTYVGSMPGKIIAGMREAGVMNPVMLLDEIDKLGADYRGDPAAAMLEVLDGEHNKSFKDHFIDIPFDLSNVFFITTANTIDTVPAPLLDRMDIIELTSYTHEEKFNIAKKHLIPKLFKRHGLSGRMLKIDDGAINDMIMYYTREAGVRGLEKLLATICRKAAKELLTSDVKKVTVKSANLHNYLGVRKFIPDRIPEADRVGVVTGLAYTTVGGEIMPLEVSVMDGTGKIELTGSLGDVMKESAKAAISFIRANAARLGVNGEFYKTKDIHIHAPEGAVPKDGPSAGCAMATALYSELSGRAVKRDIAMTGEITIRGHVLAIGGLKEKTMAAYKAGVKTVILPAENKPDIEEIAQVVKDNIRFVYAKEIDEVFKEALL